MASFSDMFWLDEKNFQRWWEHDLPQNSKTKIRVSINRSRERFRHVGVGQSQRNILKNSPIEFTEWPRPTHVGQRHTFSINRFKVIWKFGWKYFTNYFYRMSGHGHSHSCGGCDHEEHFELATDFLLHTKISDSGFERGQQLYPLIDRGGCFAHVRLQPTIFS